MRRLERLIKTARLLSSTLGHELGLLNHISKTKYVANCIHCNLDCIICTRSDIKINSGKPFNDPKDLTPMMAAKISAAAKRELEIDLYTKRQGGYIYGATLIKPCTFIPPAEPLPEY